MKMTPYYYTYFLIDYDNLGLSEVSEIKSFLDQIISIFYEKDLLDKMSHTIFNVRLYGGWDELVNDDYDGVKNQASRKALDLTNFIDGHYPDVSIKPKYSVNVSLIHSLAIRPHAIYPFTYRKRETLSRIHVCSKEDACCDGSTQHIDYLKKLKKHSKCPLCNKKSSINIWTSEQKLVDTMLAMDLSFFAQTDPQAMLVLISDDDDFIPVMFQQGMLNKKIFHITRNPGRCFMEYKKIAPIGYYENITI